MEEYNSFEEKGIYFIFGDVRIDNDKDFNYYTDLLQVQYAQKNFIFRGVSEAKFKMFNSAQILWEKNSSEEDYYDENKYDELIIFLMDECKKWNFGSIPNYFKTYSISDKNAVAYLSLMRHYGIPTPLIDFTKNPNNALYFAVESISDKCRESHYEIDNYFSIYYTYQTNMAYDSFQDVFNKNRENKKAGEFDYSDLTKNGIVLITDDIDEFKIVNNIRIANQEGLFFYNNSPYLPIEEQYKGVADSLLERVGRQEFDRLLVHDTFAGCLNFHKKYASHIKKVLNNMQITKEFIYPELSDLAKHINKFFYKESTVKPHDGFISPSRKKNQRRKR
ncbi:MAG: FRG domain-containing protein [Candidatus Symbiothrix sp.]|jgi:hypothetical protein|nr:FRG domain-containing protein [Candidatus Symbiothrix sp.]